MDDEKGRTALADFLGTFEQRVFHVGRLDADSEGLLLLTNDGALAHKLMHPSYEVPKTYLAEVAGPLPRAVGPAAAAPASSSRTARRGSTRSSWSTRSGKTAQIEIVLHEGRKHIVRRMMDEVGHPVQPAVRTAVGPIRLGDLRPGGIRRLSNAEVGGTVQGRRRADSARRRHE